MTTWAYSDTALDHFLNPRNVGELPEADIVADIKTPNGKLELSIKLNAAKTIISIARFRAIGCPGAIASASAMTELITNNPLD